MLEALGSGQSYGMVTGAQKGQTIDQKVARVKKDFPRLQHVEVKSDSLFISLSDTGYFQFIGQGGKVLSKQDRVMMATYIIRPQDAYVRTRIFFASGEEIDLNPVIRYNGQLQNPPIATINNFKTFSFRCLGSLIIGLAFLPFFLRIKFLRKRE